jgi:hypothetical protein
MKNLILSFGLFILTTRAAVPHGLGGDSYTTDAARETRERQSSPVEKSFTKPFAARPHWWSARLATGWTSREMHYGFDETGPYGAWTTELTLRIDRLSLSVWSGFGTGNDYEEWDFTTAYTFETETFFLTPGYNFRYQPGVIPHEHSESVSHDHGTEADHEHSHHQEEDRKHSHQDPGHLHGTYGNELFFVVGTKAIPHVTPTLLFVCDLNNTPGSYLQMRIDGAVPLFRSIFVLEPYVLLGLNLGYNTTAYYGWNHFQFGLKASWKINRFVSITGGISYSVALTALQQIDQGNEVWASAGVTFSY